MRNVPWAFLFYSLSMLGLGVYATHISSSMVDDVNRRLPKDQQFDHWVWYPTKYLRLVREYKRLYPNGPLNRTRIIIQIAMFALLIFAAAFIQPF
jgi:hypothetical protein